MGKISVFKFNLENEDKDVIETMVKEYINSKGLVYNSDEKMYTTLKPSKKNDRKNMVASVGATLLTGNTTVYYSMGRGLSYSIEGNQLIIKACVINYKLNNAKQFIHSTFNNTQAGTWFYNDLKKELFKELEKSGIELASKEVEKVNDGAGKTFAKKVLIILAIMIAVIILLMKL